MLSLGRVFGPVPVAKRYQNGPREVEDLIDSTMAKRNVPLKLGICSKCGSDYYTYSTGLFCSNKCSQIKNNDNGDGYKRITVNGKRIYEHRHVVSAESGFIVHHINGNKTDNRPENLEVMTQSEHCSQHQVEMKEAQYGS